MSIKIIESADELMKLYIFMNMYNDSIGNDVKFRDYKYMWNNGLAYKILSDKNEIVGGFMITTNSRSLNELFNMYIPDGKSWVSILKKIKKYICDSNSDYLIFNLKDASMFKNRSEPLNGYGEDFYKIKLCKEGI